MCFTNKLNKLNCTILQVITMINFCIKIAPQAEQCHSPWKSVTWFTFLSSPQVIVDCIWQHALWCSSQVVPFIQQYKLKVTFLFLHPSFLREILKLKQHSALYLVRRQVEGKCLSGWVGFVISCFVLYFEARLVWCSDLYFQNVAINSAYSDVLFNSSSWLSSSNVCLLSWYWRWRPSMR